MPKPKILNPPQERLESKMDLMHNKEEGPLFTPFKVQVYENFKNMKVDAKKAGTLGWVRFR